MGRWKLLRMESHNKQMSFQVRETSLQKPWMINKILLQVAKRIKAIEQKKICDLITYKINKNQKINKRQSEKKK